MKFVSLALACCSRMSSERASELSSNNMRRGWRYFWPAKPVQLRESQSKRNCGFGPHTNLRVARREIDSALFPNGLAKVVIPGSQRVLLSRSRRRWFQLAEKLARTESEPPGHLAAPKRSGVNARWTLCVNLLRLARRSLERIPCERRGKLFSLLRYVSTLELTTTTTTKQKNESPEQYHCWRHGRKLLQRCAK